MNLLRQRTGRRFFSLLKFKRKSLPPLAEVFLLAGVYAGCAFNLVFLFQLLMGADPQPYMEEGVNYVFRMNSSDYFVMACLCVVPVLFLIHCVQLMVLLVKEKAAKQESIHYENTLLEGVNLFLYDTYGYPVSKHIKSAWSADITYLIMKPLEWLFLVVLYLFDEKPENRICRQYLPAGNCEFF